MYGKRTEYASVISCKAGPEKFVAGEAAVTTEVAAAVTTEAKRRINGPSQLESLRHRGGAELQILQAAGCRKQQGVVSSFVGDLAAVAAATLPVARFPHAALPAV